MHTIANDNLNYFIINPHDQLIKHINHLNDIMYKLLSKVAWSKIELVNDLEVI